MDYIRDIETSKQEQELLKMLDKQEVGHVYDEELGWKLHLFLELAFTKKYTVSITGLSLFFFFLGKMTKLIF